MRIRHDRRENRKRRGSNRILPKNQQKYQVSHRGIDADRENDIKRWVLYKHAIGQLESHGT